MSSKAILFLFMVLAMLPGIFDFAISQNSNCYTYAISSGMLESKTEQAQVTTITGQAIVGRTQTHNDEAKLGFLNFAEKPVTGNIDDNKSILIENVNLYPNPCGNFIDIIIGRCEAIRYSIIITNYQGQILWKNNFVNNPLWDFKTRLNTSSYACGIYFVLVSTDKQRFVKSFVKF